MKALFQNYGSLIFTFITTLLATIVGAIASYLATSKAEKKKEKRQSKKDLIDDILVPYSGVLEEALDIFKEIDIEDYRMLEYRLKSPLLFLKAEKRVYLSREQRQELQDYEKRLSVFFSTWEKEQALLLKEYQNFISGEFLKWESLPITTRDDIQIIMDCDLSDLKTAIFKKQACDLKNHIIGIDLICWDKESSEPIYIQSLKFDQEVINICGRIETGSLDWDDVRNDDEKALATGRLFRTECKAYEHLFELEDIDFINGFLINTETQRYYKNLKDKAEAIHSSVVEEIDGIVDELYCELPR